MEPSCSEIFSCACVWFMGLSTMSATLRHALALLASCLAAQQAQPTGHQLAIPAISPLVYLKSRTVSAMTLKSWVKCLALYARSVSADLDGRSMKCLFP